MTTYRCEACGKDLEVEEIAEDLIEVTPCEVCIGVAEEAVKQESYDDGYQEGWQDAEKLAEEEEGTKDEG